MVTLTNVGASYDAIAASKGLDAGLVDMTGATQVIAAVYVSKLGSGTQSWQLWNHTDGTELGVITDSGAAGDKLLQQTFNIPTPLTGFKYLRWRCKSTVGTDDPIFYSGSAQVR